MARHYCRSPSARSCGFKVFPSPIRLPRSSVLVLDDPISTPPLAGRPASGCRNRTHSKVRPTGLGNLVFPLQRLIEPPFAGRASCTDRMLPSPSRSIHQTDPGPPLLRFFSLQRFQAMPRCPRPPSLTTIPLRRSTRWHRCRRSVSAPSFVHAVFRLASITCGSRRKTHDPHRFPQVMRR